MMFFSTLFKVCSGTSVFIQLLTRPLWRASLHFIMLAVLAGFLFAFGYSCSCRAEVSRVCGALFENIGGFSITAGKGLVTINEPGLKRSIRLNADWSLAYIPKGSILETKDLSEWNSRIKLICVPRGLIVAVVVNTDGGPRYLAAPFSLDDFTGFTKILMTAPETVDFVNRAFAMPEKGGLKLRSGVEEKTLDSPDEAAGQILTMIGVIMFFHGLFSVIVVGLIGIVFFSLTRRFLAFAPPETPRLTFKPTLVIMIYTAFPPVVIASAVSVFSLDQTWFSAVFFVTLFIYHIFVFAAVNKYLSPPKAEISED